MPRRTAGIRLADAHGAAEVRAVPVDDRAESNMTTSPSSAGAVRVASAELFPSPNPVKTCVVNEGTREPWSRIRCSTSSTSSSIVTP